VPVSDSAMAWRIRALLRRDSRPRSRNTTQWGWSGPSTTTSGRIAITGLNPVALTRCAGVRLARELASLRESCRLL
jgi:hypothetical protein